MTALSRRSFLLGTVAVVGAAVFPKPVKAAAPLFEGRIGIWEGVRFADHEGAMMELCGTGFVGFALYNSGAVEMLRYEDVFGGATVTDIVDSE